MLEPPFEIISCSWPRPVAQRDDCWVSEPEWDAPLMPILPQPHWELIRGEAYLMVNWREWFRAGLKFWSPNLGGEMRNFHIVFRLRIHGDGTLAFCDDDGSIIRRNGQVIHRDSTVHPLQRSEVRVQAGDYLEIAQWQHYGDWLWGARLMFTHASESASAEFLAPYLEAVQKRLCHPNGPPLKMYFGDGAPIRTVLALYSMILNGYCPSQVFVFGDYQWSAASAAIFRAWLPFAEFVPAQAVLSHIQSLAGGRLVELAKRHWSVMKTCVTLLYPPDEFCFMDDDVFILDSVSDALNAFQRCNLVFAPDDDYSNVYQRTWGRKNRATESLRTGRLNTGLYWLRNRRNASTLAADLLSVPVNQLPVWQWEQGFMATQFADETVLELPTQSYFYPYFDGLPGGMLGYDYALNPCGFVSIHFGGLAAKPDDGVARLLAADILCRGHQPRRG